MSEKIQGILYYHIEDHEFLAEILGCPDPEKDGVLTASEWKELESQCHDFYYENLTSQEKELFQSFTQDKPLSRLDFADNPELVRIAQKSIHHYQSKRILTDRNLPEEFDIPASPEILPFINQLKLPVAELKNTLSREEWQLLSSPSLSDQELALFKTPTLSILRELIAQNLQGQVIEVSFSEWQKTYETLQISSEYSAQQSWQELLLIWHQPYDVLHEQTWTHTPFHVSLEILNWFMQKITGDESKIFQNDFTIQPWRLKKYLQEPQSFLPAKSVCNQTQSPFPLTEAEAIWQSTWPETETQIDLLESFGVETHGISTIHFDIAPQATARAVATATGESWDMSQPTSLIALQGFQLNWDKGDFANTGLSVLKYNSPKWLKQTWRALKREYVTHDLDMESISVLGISAFQNRIYLVLKGEDHSQDLLQPLDGEIFYLDLSFVIKSLLQSDVQTKTLADLLFDENNSLKDNVPLEKLQSVLLDILKRKTKTKSSENLSLAGLVESSQWQSVRHEFWIKGVEADFAHLVPKIDSVISSEKIKEDVDISLQSLSLSQGEVYGEKISKEKIEIRGKANLNTALTSEKYFSEKIGNVDLNTRFFVRINPQTQKAQGYIALSLPDLSLQIAATPSEYSGEVLIGFDLEHANWFENGKFASQKFFDALGLHLLASLKREHTNFLAFVLNLQELTLDPTQKEVLKTMIDYKLAYADPEKNFYGIVRDGKIWSLKNKDQNGGFISQEYHLKMQHLTKGGLQTLLGDDYGLFIEKDAKGTFHIRPQLQRSYLQETYHLEAENFLGEIRMTPIRNDEGKVYRFDIEVENLEVNIPDVEVWIKDKRLRGQSHLVLTGKWQTNAENILEALTSLKWQGKGEFHLKRKNNLMLIDDPENGDYFSFPTEQIDTDFIVDVIEFHPLEGQGKLTERFNNGEVHLKKGAFQFDTDLNGYVSVSGRYPLVRFYALKALGQEIHQNRRHAVSEIQEEIVSPSVEDLRESIETQQNHDRERIEAALKEPIEHFHKTNSTDLSLSYFLSDEFPLLEALQSLEEIHYQVSNLSFGKDLHYIKKTFSEERVARLPLIKGVFQFLNPKLQEETFFHHESEQTLFVDNQLKAGTLVQFNKPIKFLGFSFAKLELVESRQKNNETLSLVLTTKNGKTVNVLKWLSIFNARKFKQITKSLERQNIFSPATEIPVDVDLLSIFLKEFQNQFSWQERWQDKIEAEFSPFQPGELKKFSGVEREQILRVLHEIFPDVKMPRRAGQRVMAAYLNQLSETENLSDVLFENLDVYSSEKRSLALQVMRKVLSSENDEEKNSLHYKLLRVLMQSQVNRPKWFHWDQAQIKMNGILTPQPATYPVISFTDETPSEVAFEASLQEELTHFSLTTPEADPLIGADFHYKDARFQMSADIFQLEGVDLALETETESRNKVLSVSFPGQNRFANVEAFAYPPISQDLPVFAFFPSQEGIGANVNNTVDVDSIRFTADSGYRTVDVNLNKVDVRETSLYIGKRKDLIPPDDLAEYKDSLVALDQISSQGFQVIAESHPLLGSTGLRLEGTADLGGMKQEKKRALIYIGTDQNGKNHYLPVEDVITQAQFSFVDNTFQLQGYVDLELEPPPYLKQEQVFQDLKELGIFLDVQKISVTGAMRLYVDSERGQVTHYQNNPFHDGPLTVRLQGDFVLDNGKSRLELATIEIPLDEASLKMIQKHHDDGLRTTKTILETITIPAEKIMIDGLSGRVELPEEAGLNETMIQNAEFVISSEGLIQFDQMEGTPHLSIPQGLRGHLEDEEGKNILDLKTGIISYKDHSGEIQEWQISGHMQDLMEQSLAEFFLKGELFQFKRED